VVKPLYLGSFVLITLKNCLYLWKAYIPRYCWQDVFWHTCAKSMKAIIHWLTPKNSYMERCVTIHSHVSFVSSLSAQRIEVPVSSIKCPYNLNIGIVVRWKVILMWDKQLLVCDISAAIVFCNTWPNCVSVLLLYMLTWHNKFRHCSQASLRTVSEYLLDDSHSNASISTIAKHVL